jgi:hypothetical protein
LAAPFADVHLCQALVGPGRMPVELWASPR